MKKSLDAHRLTDLRRLALLLLGTCVYCVGMNLFIVPAHLYSGGIMGICQLIRTLLTRELGLSFGGVDIAGILYYICNLPILLLSWRRLDRSFVLKTLLSVSVMTVLLTLIPVQPLLSSDTITSCLVGGVIVGAGMGMVLRAGGTLGGFDLVSLMIVRKHHDLSVGRIGLSVNVAVYALCMAILNVPTAIYSLVYSAVSTTTMDKVYVQNQDVEAKIITKRSPEELDSQVFDKLHRGVTLLHGVGAYTEEAVNVLYVTLSEYELPMLRRLVSEADPHAFVVVKSRVRVYGNYQKKL